MIKADLHVHSRFSEHPNDWFLQRIGAAESYTEPEYIYKKGLERGMDLITITDHNRIDGALLLKEKYPDRVITGMEATTYFPEDGCKIHVMIYGLDRRQAEEIQIARKSIYDLRDYIVKESLACSVAHATYAVNDKLTVDHLEKLILLFDVFEGINGARERLNNETWMEVLSSLTPEQIDELKKKHGIVPMSDDPWIKGFTGGSDDHAGIFMGQTCTTAAVANNPEEFLQAIRDRKTLASGSHSNYKYMAFNLYKIAYDFSRSRSGTQTKNMVSQLTEAFFERGNMTLAQKWNLAIIRIFNTITGRGDRIKLHFSHLLDAMNDQQKSLEEKMDFAYEKIGDIGDELFHMLTRSLEKDLKKGDVFSLIRNISTSIPGIFLSLPFFTTLHHMYQGRDLVQKTAERFGKKRDSGSKKVLWFTDTLNDLNGVSVTLKKIGWASYHRGREIRMVTALLPDEINEDLPPNTMLLPYVYKFKLPYYEKYILKVPSVLKAIEQIYKYDPDEIYISTPGPIGLLGLLASRLLSAKVTGIYHTDFTMQAKEIMGQEAALKAIENGTHFFYSMMDTIMVPTVQYMNILEERNYDRSRMALFRRGIDTEKFYPMENGKEYLKETWGIQDGKTLVFAGRISRDKNLDMLMGAYEKLIVDHPETNLLLAGDGPHLEALKNRMKRHKRVHFPGKIHQNDLPMVYSGADFLVFPSHTDTFGMAVLEAQTCGLPCIVSDMGGPQEIILPEQTGAVVPAFDEDAWANVLGKYLTIMDTDSDAYQKMREESRNLALRRNDWRVVIDTFLGSDDQSPLASMENQAVSS